MAKRDLAWIIVILVVLIIGTMTFYCGGKSNDMVSYIGFAGTITSMILSVLAIVYSYTQSATSLTQSQRLGEMVDRIGNAVDSLESTSATLRVSMDQVRSNVDELGSSFEENISALTQEVRSIPGKLGGPSVPAPPPSPQFMKEAVGRASNMGLVALLLASYQAQHHLEKDLKSLLEAVGEREYEYCFGFLIGFTGTGVLAILASPGMLSAVVAVEPELFRQSLEEEISSRQKRAHEEGNQPVVSYLAGKIDAVRGVFQQGAH